jgi:hypothetical protein
MAEVEFSGNQVIVKIPKAILVMTREEFKRALKRGRAWRRAQEMKARGANTEREL